MPLTAVAGQGPPEAQCSRPGAASKIRSAPHFIELMDTITGTIACSNTKDEQDICISSLPSSTTVYCFPCIHCNGEIIAEGNLESFTTESILPYIVGMWNIIGSTGKVTGRIEILQDGTAKKYTAEGKESISWTSTSWKVNASGAVYIHFYRNYNSYNYSQDIWEDYNGMVNSIENPTKIIGKETHGACNSNGGYSENTYDMILTR